jgi:hypothetical protein
MLLPMCLFQRDEIGHGSSTRFLTIDQIRVSQELKRRLHQGRWAHERIADCFDAQGSSTIPGEIVQHSQGDSSMGALGYGALLPCGDTIRFAIKPGDDRVGQRGSKGLEYRDGVEVPYHYTTPAVKMLRRSQARTARPGVIVRALWCLGAGTIVNRRVVGECDGVSFPPYVAALRFVTLWRNIFCLLLKPVDQGCRLCPMKADFAG